MSRGSCGAPWQPHPARSCAGRVAEGAEVWCLHSTDFARHSQQLPFCNPHRPASHIKTLPPIPLTCMHSAVPPSRRSPPPATRRWGWQVLPTCMAGRYVADRERLSWAVETVAMGVEAVQATLQSPITPLLLSPSRAPLRSHRGEASPRKKCGPRCRTPGASTLTADLPLA